MRTRVCDQRACHPPELLGTQTGAGGAGKSPFSDRGEEMQVRGAAADHEAETVGVSRHIVRGQSELKRCNYTADAGQQGLMGMNEITRQYRINQQPPQHSVGGGVLVQSDGSGLGTDAHHRALPPLAFLVLRRGILGSFSQLRRGERKLSLVKWF